MSPPESTPRVLITGIGLATALADTCEATWDAIRLGKSAIRPLDFLPHAGAKFRARTHHEPALTLSRLATREALRDSLLAEDPGRIDADPERVATIIGMSKGGLQSLGLVAARIRDPQTPGWIGPVWQSQCLPNSAAAGTGIESYGPSLAPVAACATGLIAAIQGADLIRRGVCDVAICGATDASLEPLMLAAFARMKATASPGGDPSRSVRPWDRRRSGFQIGEGAAILVLEREDHARSRRALAYAEFAGGAFGSDAYHITDLNPDPAGLAHLIQLALRNSGVEPTDIDHINVHGTATRQNDPLECRAIRLAFGSHADSISCSANKPQIGHLLGAAGAAELAITCLALRDGFVPPTLNLDDPDPLCDLDGTPNVGKSRTIRAALKLSIGFGGHLAAAVLGRYDGPKRPPVPRPPNPDPHV